MADAKGAEIVVSSLKEDSLDLSPLASPNLQQQHEISKRR
jgi:hypothetical protein